MMLISIALLISVAPPCVATPMNDRLPGVIAPMAGDGPVWLVQGLNGRWIGEPIKSVWVVDRKAAGDLTVTGKRLDGTERLNFKAEMAAPISGVLTKAKPIDQSMTPGGAGADVMRQYVFVGSYVIYPAPGCWALDVALGPSRQRIIVSLK